MPPEETGQKQVTTRFQKGVSGNPAGRPRGARSRLGEQFVQALADDFETHGIDVIKQVRMRDPLGYTKVIVSVLPREVLVQAFSAHISVDLAELERTKGRLAAYRFARDMLANPMAQAEIIADEGAIATEGWRLDHDDE
jgi:hypothetical protein